MSIAQQQTEIINQLIEISYEKRLAITDDDIDALRTCTEREVTLVGKLNALTKAGEAPDAAVVALAKELKKRNNINDELIKTHLQFVNTMITLLTPDNDPLNNYYGGDGRALDSGTTKLPGMLDVSV